MQISWIYVQKNGTAWKEKFQLDELGELDDSFDINCIDTV